MVLLLLLLTLSTVTAQNITVPAVQRIFDAVQREYPDFHSNFSISVESIATLMNTRANDSNCDFVAITQNRTVIEELYLLKEYCSQFQNHRSLVKQFVDGLFAHLPSTKLITKYKSAELKGLFWRIDKAKDNVLSATYNNFIVEIATLVKEPKKLAKVIRQINDDRYAFTETLRIPRERFMSFKFTKPSDLERLGNYWFSK